MDNVRAVEEKSRCGKNWSLKMTNFLYTDRISGLLKEGRVGMSKADFVYLINTSEIFHMPYGDCIKLGDSFIHSIILDGWRWDATTKEWLVLPEGKVLELETPTFHALLTTEIRGKEAVLVLLAVTLLTLTVLIETATIVYFLLK